MKRRSFLLAGLLLAVLSFAQTDAQILKAIRLVETGDNPRALGDYHLGLPTAFGAYQMHKGAWAEGNAQLRLEGKPAYPMSQWQRLEAQQEVASAYLRGLRRRFEASGLPSPSPEQFALVWKHGWEGAHLLGLSPDDYAQRVGNLSRLK